MLQKPQLFFILLTCTLAGCWQSPQPQVVVAKQVRINTLSQMQRWHAEGRLCISDAKQTITASFTWDQNYNKFRTYFYSPFSTESVTITGDDTHINVIATKGEKDEEIQLEKHLPFTQLKFWLKGLPAANSEPQKISYDAYNQLQTLQQDGWLIEYHDYNSIKPISLPEKITITDGHTKVKLLIKNWKK